jgi:hypothetical protein
LENQDFLEITKLNKICQEILRMQPGENEKGNKKPHPFLDRA